MTFAAGTLALVFFFRYYSFSYEMTSFWLYIWLWLLRRGFVISFFGQFNKVYSVVWLGLTQVVICLTVCYNWFVSSGTIAFRAAFSWSITGIFLVIWLSLLIRLTVMSLEVLITSVLVNILLKYYYRTLVMILIRLVMLISRLIILVTVLIISSQRVILLIWPVALSSKVGVLIVCLQVEQYLRLLNNLHIFFKGVAWVRCS